MIKSSYLNHTKPTIKIYITFTINNYNATTTVVYYNTQSILVSFPINMGVFSP